MTDDPCQDERGTAYHEAAHAVVGMVEFPNPDDQGANPLFRQAARFETVSIVPTEESCGRVTWDVPFIREWYAEQDRLLAEAIAEGSISPDETSIGDPQEWGAEWANYVDIDIMVGYAGGIAESLSKDEKPDYNKLTQSGCNSDFKQALLLGQLRAPDDIPRPWADSNAGVVDTETGLYLTWLFHRTQVLVRTPGVWIQIEAVAKALLERKVLTYEEVGIITLGAFSALSFEEKREAFTTGNMLFASPEPEP